MRRSGTTLALLLLPGVGYLAVFFGLPLILAVAGSFGIGTIGKDTGFTLVHYGELFGSQTYRDGLLFSLYLSVVPTLSALLIAVPLAVALQASFPGKRLFATLYKVPLVVPSLVAAFLLMVFLDRGGMVSRMLTPLGLSLPKLVRDPLAIGVIIAMAWKAVPFMTLIIAGALAAVPDDLKLAARTLGAGPLRTFLLVDLPLALPGITAATLLVFVGSTGAFAIPNLLGPIYPQPLSLYMYENAYVENNWGLVAAMGTVLSLVACLVLLGYYRVTDRVGAGAAR
jgi:putative spermidine/putrescine transport system permease protein